MRKMLSLCLLLPALALGQSKNVVNYFRVFPKADKALALEKALAEHGKKYHTGNWKWHVFEIQTGPDAGGYHIIEGPLSWTDFDGRGDLGSAHMTDWNNMVAPLTTGAGTMAFVTFLEEFSTVQLTDYAEKVIVNHIYPKPGMLNQAKDLAAKMKKVWQASGESVAVFEASYSGEPQLAIATRLKGGLKELEPNFRKPLPERFNEANGANSWDEYLKSYAACIERRWMEMMFLRADLSAK